MSGWVIWPTFCASVMPATIAWIFDSTAESGAIALTTRGHSDIGGSAALAGATAAAISNDARIPIEILASELIVDSQQIRDSVGVVFQRRGKRSAGRQGCDLDRPVGRIGQVVDLQQDRQSLRRTFEKFVAGLEVHGLVGLDLRVADLVEIGDNLARERRAVGLCNPDRGAVLFIVKR